MSLSRMDVEDKIVWGPSKKGLFSVKSTYHLEFDRKKANQCDYFQDIDKRWKSMWDLNVPQKVK